MFWLSLGLIIIAGISNAIMDKIQFHFDKSIFNKLNGNWWNPVLSWKNKWKNGDYEEGEKFWGSSRWFVRFTDAWHFFQGLMFTCLMLSIVLYQPLFNWYIDFVILYFSLTGTFYLFYSKIFKR